MPSIPIYPPSTTGKTTGIGQKVPLTSNPHNPLPSLLQTPSGLALIELQGTVNTQHLSAEERAVGWLEFPLYDPSQHSSDPASGAGSEAWMKKVLLFVGAHQRLTGEVKKLAKPVGVLRRREGGADGEEALEIVDVVRYKILFAHRPEPIGWKGAETGDLGAELEV